MIMIASIEKGAVADVFEASQRLSFASARRAQAHFSAGPPG
jgi:hypothetical protein